ncbi:MAG: class I SAM-dependent methyltransferase [Candidatus Competibacteraceae bacterium]
MVICAACGAGYADDIPAQEAFDHYYAEMSKYEYTDRSGIQSETDLQRFREIANLVALHLQATHHLLDIGCATGGLLAEFKRRGFSNLLGVDPSPCCTQLTEQAYGIPSRSLSISALDRLGEQFDAIFLTGVLEHLREVDSSLNKVKACLRPGGLIYFEVPDATRYDHHFSAPFQFFSMEHVNFFSPTSLRNLLARHGFSCVFTERLIRYLSPKAIEPGVGGLFRWDSTERSVITPVRDDETEPALQRYIQQSRNLEQRIQEKISALADTGRPLAVWGVGTHTLRLLETSRLPNTRIIAFIDSNVHYQGKTLVGKPVVAPSVFADRDTEILISSHTAEEEIFQFITQKLHWPNTVHRLYAG